MLSRYKVHKEGRGKGCTLCWHYVAKESVSYHILSDTLTTTPKEELKSLAEDLKEEVPAPLHTMLVEKESKEEAITKYRQRKEKETVICPPTCTGIIIIK